MMQWRGVKLVDLVDMGRWASVRDLYMRIEDWPYYKSIGKEIPR